VRQRRFPSCPGLITQKTRRDLTNNGSVRESRRCRSLGSVLGGLRLPERDQRRLRGMHAQTQSAQTAALGQQRPWIPSGHPRRGSHPMHKCRVARGISTPTPSQKSGREPRGHPGSIVQRGRTPSAQWTKEGACLRFGQSAEANEWLDAGGLSASSISGMAHLTKIRSKHPAGRIQRLICSTAHRSSPIRRRMGLNMRRDRRESCHSGDCKPPAPDGPLPHRFGGRHSPLGLKLIQYFPQRFLDRRGRKVGAQKVKAVVRGTPAPIRHPTVHDVCLVRMEFQMTSCANRAGNAGFEPVGCTAL